MCVKIINLDEELDYNISIPLEYQLENSSKIVIDYQQNDPSIEKFIKEVKRICQSGIDCDLNISVKVNDFIAGAKLKRQAKNIETQNKLNELIKLMVLSQYQADKKLEELSSICLGINENVRS